MLRVPVEAAFHFVTCTQVLSMSGAGPGRRGSDNEKYTWPRCCLVEINNASIKSTEQAEIKLFRRPKQYPEVFDAKRPFVLWLQFWHKFVWNSSGAFPASSQALSPRYAS